MPKRSRWQNLSLIWKAIVAVSIIIGIPASVATILQVLGAADIWRLLILPLYNFFTLSVSIYYVVLVIIALVILSYLLVRFRILGSNVLDTDYGRQIAILCQTPRTTDYLRGKYEDWKSQSPVILVRAPHFNDYIKQLENQGYLKYRDGKWEVTDKALDYIEKYHGG
jgi:hypothetical protein